MMACLLDNGSRTQANAAAAARAAANGGLAQSVDMQYTLLNNFMLALSAQIAVLNNPSMVARRQHTAGQ